MLGKLDVVHSIALANREDLSRPLVDTSRDGFLLAQEVSVYSSVSVARATAPLTIDGGALMTLTYLGLTRVLTNYNVRGVAKSGPGSAVRYLPSELGEKKIPVNAISAPPVKTRRMMCCSSTTGFTSWGFSCEYQNKSDRLIKVM